MAKIRAVALDVDGVFTDGGVWWNETGEAFKRFSFRDIMGVSLGRKAGYQFALISGEGGPLLDRLAMKLGIEAVFPDCKDKAAALRLFSERTQLPPEAICFLGDDVNDLEALALAGLSACPADAHASVKAKVDWVLEARGGQGAVRELLDRLMGN